MAYLRNEPIATDDLDISQPKLAGNTNAADDSFGINHYQFSDLTANNGKHKPIVFPNSLIAPPTPTGANEIVFYNGGSSIGGANNLFMIPPSSSTPIQISRNDIPVNASKGKTWIPGGLLIQWGQVSGSPIANGTVETFFTPFTTVYSIAFAAGTSVTDDKTINYSALNNNGFTIITSGSSNFLKLNYIAIGK